MSLAVGPHRCQKEHAGSLGAGVTVVSQVLGIEPGSTGRTAVLLTAKSSLRTQEHIFIKTYLTYAYD